MPRSDALLTALTIWGLLVGTVAAGEPAGENIARSAPYTLFPRPAYRHCTDPGDAVQLTDGKTTSAYFWTQPGTVGWQNVQYATVTVDLAAVQPIAGVSLTTAAGTAGVTWPMAVHVLVSDDSKTYYDAGELIALDQKHRGPWPQGYAVRRLATDELRTRGRYVQFVIIPLPGGPYVFTDEVEVFRGDPAWLKPVPPVPLDIEPVVNARQLYEEGRIRRAVQHRFQHDGEAIERAIREAESLKRPDRKRLLERIGEAARGFDSSAIPGADSFRAVLPTGDAHARLFAVQADLWRALGRPALGAWVPAVWDPVDAFVVPPIAPKGRIEVHTMRGEYRAGAVNLANTTDRPLSVRLRFEGLPGAPDPDYVTVHEVQWTDTSQGVPVAAALPEAARDGNGWRVTVLPGLVRQVWLTFRVGELAAGRYDGKLIAESKGDAAVEVPLRLRVWPLMFPEKTTLKLGGWSYTDVDARGVTPNNRAAFLQHLQSHFVNAPWATSGVMRSYEFDKRDPTKIHLDTSRLDDWIGQWPNADAYLVFLAVAHYSGALKSSLGGAEIGSPEFDRRVGLWISAWVRHLRSKGITPDKLGLLIHDEPHEGSDVGPLLAWARAIRKAEPEVVIWEDPTYRNPSAAPAELFEVCDVLCPNRPMWLGQGERFARFYRDQQSRGRTLQFYSCSGSAKLLDPYSYYRLQAWHCRHVGGTGSFFWAFGDNGGASSWNEHFAKAGPYTPLFLDEQTVTPGKHMEAIRESVEDYEYFVMLGSAVEQAKAAGRWDDAVRRAETLLRSASGEVLTAAGAGSLRWHETKDRTIADRVRVKILEALVSLKAEN